MLRLNARFSALRRTLGQASWAVREYRKPRRVMTQVRVNRSLSFDHPLPWGPHRPGSAWGVSVVRDEHDIIESVVAHHLDQGLDGVIVADNGSTDGTREILRRLAAADRRLHVCADGWMRHDQSEKVTRLAGLARRCGADWIVPFDGDELWFARCAALGEYFAEVSRREPETTMLYADWFNMAPVDPWPATGRDTEFLLDATPVFPGKVAVRAHPWLVIGQGNHSAARVGAARRSELAVGHVPFRGAAQLVKKFRRGALAEERSGHDVAWHWREGASLDDDQIANAWRRIRSGQPEAAIGFPAVGPMVHVKPLSWRTWDPESAVPEPAR